MDLLQAFLRLHVPRFFESELFQLEEEIAVVPSAGGRHGHAVAWFARTAAREAFEELHVRRVDLPKPFCLHVRHGAPAVTAGAPWRGAGTTRP
ncbi:hypothetical protein AB0C76_09845 [Kitasatospora sp. NPDC048722]|uniref:hypothetical protein n=1 Tax=Kitasatospora sp. NPDC048722 TaxID=3155639 RepID=UPI0033C2882E